MTERADDGTRPQVANLRFCAPNRRALPSCGRGTLLRRRCGRDRGSRRVATFGTIRLGDAEHGVLGGDSCKLAQGRSLIDRYVRAGAWRKL
jgi:hypothetical protein